MIDINKPLDQLDYIVVPIEIMNDEHAWQVQLLRGEHKDKKLVFTKIEYSGKKNILRFLLDVVNDNVLEKASKELEDLGFDILEDIIKRGIADGSVVFNDQDSSN